jgi:hypothetical protein
MAAAMTTAASAATSAAAPALEPLLRQAARAVREADALLFTSGAGLGVDSGARRSLLRARAFAFAACGFSPRPARVRAWAPRRTTQGCQTSAA